MTRVMIGQCFQETNSFNERLTTGDNFTVYTGDEIIPALKGSGSIIGGIIDKLLESDGVTVIPTVAALAWPGGPVQHALFLEYAEIMVRTARESNPDAVVLDLHGAMATTQSSDPEGDLLSSLRSAVGPDCVISAGFDLHGHVTKSMLEAADIITACKHNPHSDFYDTGRRAATLALETLSGAIEPTTAYSRIPLLLEANKMTDSGPLKEAHELARRRQTEDRRILDVSIFNTFPMLDAPDMGQVSLTISDGNNPDSVHVCEEINALLWRRRDEFRNTYPSVAEGVQYVLDNPEQMPFVVADFGDQVLAGGPGDNIDVLEEILINAAHLRSVLPLTDPRVVETAISLGVGARIQSTIGGMFTRDGRSIEIDGRVVALTDGDFVMHGPLGAGLKTSHGATAVIDVGKTRIIATTFGPCTQDLNFYRSSGVVFDQFDVVVVKSGQHFRLSFADVGEPLWVNSSGIGTYRAGALPVKRELVYPEVRISLDSIQGEVLGAAAS